MIFTYYQIPPINTGSYQCGILQAAGLPCANFGSGALGNASAVMAQMLHTYPILVQRIYPQSAIRQINAIPLGRPAYPQEIQWMINNGLPFIAGISPSMPVAIPGVAQHAVVVVGYDVDQMGNSYVTVNDPFPYNVPLLLNGPGMPPTSVPDPYLNAYVAAEQLQPGQYRVEYNHFLHGLKWVDTIDVRPVP